MRRLLILLVVLGAIGAGAAGLAGLAGMAWRQSGPLPRPGVILIAPGTGTRDVAHELQDAGMVMNALLYEAELQWQGLAAKVKAGEYAIPAHASMAQVTAILVLGKSIEHKITIAEGLTSAMAYRLVEANPILAGNAGPVPAEGALLPETYLFTRGTTRRELLARMEKAETTYLSEHWARRVQDLPLATPEQAVILASIVEKETALPEERRHIASVFINRLKAGMKLQSDPTIIYGITKGYALGRPIYQSEIEADTPYNTYAIPGLPPTPICDPGKDSLAAVLEPETGDDLYFVANGKGGHVFAATEAEHSRNVDAWRAIERGKDPGAPDPASDKGSTRRRARTR